MKRSRNCVAAVISFMLASPLAFAATSGGFDTPAGVQTMPIAVEGNAILTLTDTPSNAAAVNGTLQLSGWMGIGITTPLFPLHVVGAGGFGYEGGQGNVPIVFQSNSTGFGGLNGNGLQAFALNIDNNTGASNGRGTPTFYDRYDGNWHADITLKNGNVGIGTTSPKNSLHVNATTATYGAGNICTTNSATNAGICLESYNNNFPAGGIGIIQAIDSASSSGVQPLSVNPFGGNVGIGTASPSGLLNVYGATFIGPDPFPPASTPFPYLGVNTTNDSSAIFLSSSTLRSEIWINDTTSTMWGLNVSGSAPGWGTSPGDFWIDQNGIGPRFVISTSGNVGIGTTAPSWPLDVYNPSGNAIRGYTQDYGSTAITATGLNSQVLLGWKGYGVFCNVGSCGGYSNWTNASDARLKRDVKALGTDDGLAAILRLKPITFRWKDASRDKQDGEQLGFIAQDVEAVYPQAVGKSKPDISGVDLAGNKFIVKNAKTVAYSSLIVPLVKAIQEQQEIIATIPELKSEIATLHADIEQLKAAQKIAH